MPKIPSKKTKTYRMIKDLTEKGFSANRIQNKLRVHGLGVRRKSLLAEIRSIKKKKITSKDRTKYIPKKYRKPKPKPKVIGSIYRGSLIISSVPLHSKPFDRRYIGFRLNIYSYDKDTVKSALKSLKDNFLSLVGDVLDSLAYAKEQTLGYESPTQIIISYPDKFNNTYEITVEEQGKTVSIPERGVL